MIVLLAVAGTLAVGTCCRCLVSSVRMILLLLLQLLLRLLLAVAGILPRITVTDVNVLYLVAQVCLRCRSEKAAAEDGGGSARHADGEAAGPQRPLHCRAC